MKKIIALASCAALTFGLFAGSALAADSGAEAPAGVVEEAVMAYFAELPADNHNISAADLFAKMDAGEEMVIIDIRAAEDYAQGHLKNAINIPYAEIGKSLDVIPDDMPLYVNCYSGQTSSQTMALLNIAGKFCTNIVGGWNGGISTTEGYENYVSTDPTENQYGNYEVDPEIAAAIAAYYEGAVADNFKSYNFPVDALSELVDAESEDYTILSIRQAPDYAEAHIPGAINIPYGAGMEESFSEIPTDKPVIVYCYSGQTASQTMAGLRLLGYEAYNLAGGMGKDGVSGWLKDSLPTVAAE